MVELSILKSKSTKFRVRRPEEHPVICGELTEVFDLHRLKHLNRSEKQETIAKYTQYMKEVSEPQS